MEKGSCKGEKFFKSLLKVNRFTQAKPDFHAIYLSWEEGENESRRV